MFLNLSEVLQKENKVVSTQVDAELEQIQIAGQIYPVQAKNVFLMHYKRMAFY